MLFAIRTSIHALIKVTPFFLNYEREAELPLNTFATNRLKRFYRRNQTLFPFDKDDEEEEEENSGSLNDSDLSEYEPSDDGKSELLLERHPGEWSQLCKARLHHRLKTHAANPSHKKKLFSAFKKGFAIVLNAKAKTYGAKSFSKGKSRRADDLVDADKLKDFKESLRPIKLSFNDFDLSVKITLKSANSTRELRFTSQIDESKASSSQPESLNRAFDKAIEALSDLPEDEDDLTSGSRPYSGLADPSSAKFTPINDATNKRKNDTRSFTLKDAAASTSSSNASLAKRRRPSQLKENEGVEDVSTERDYKEAAEA
ncbi:hypothetical protein MBM_06366 [Drepanopeziza brunnea f. sp. 'multigermtubi' MB_m1]|uniref:Uncharacterized protein n=1 Tax=Marssonina brunnea f. sp. multigermtubi (strain MB_m1) TaxID=1072389 RepID=K1WCT6_MARBU|nr:uncharacterized protein MBM_06366 [Drepanopeziza brunnea f. sp. 'multigermtubi' MB_m1]EKD15150.1 hypothetical protein MBM_06366 [Drepanopeziza brunnea f. sp. 'multigermtubi' MB_m1]